ncbi:hypothetical protein DZF91_02625 [Actinomadura logoneensis]|uniref:Uncharacterized protein n=1 Tax=Actinomadura logoneensis TaxID=2293572 RepID=A0A372JT26_9ACTN|nr:hypothetical protein [Actinomadura logoneensis]RFU43175.1 hypothetical protein DZF91_02625 [Actinomadura logoneensis]
MTERSRGAPDPTESPSQDDAPSSADLSALYRTDALIEALSARALPGPPLPLVPDVPRRPLGARPAADPAFGLLSALVSDVDDGLPEVSGARPRLHRAADAVVRHRADAVVADGAASGDSGLRDDPDHSVPASPDAADAAHADGTSRPDGDGDVPEQPESKPSRRGPRTIVALGVVGAVLATTGVAAAGGGLVGSSADTSAMRIAGKPRPSGLPGTGGGGASSARPQSPAARPPVSAPGRGRDQKTQNGGPGRGTAKKNGPVSEEERLRKRLNDLLKGRPPQRPQTHTDPVAETRRRLAELRRRAEQRRNRHPHH